MVRHGVRPVRVGGGYRVAVWVRVLQQRCERIDTVENSQNNAHNPQDENPPAGVRKLGDASSSSSAAELPQDLTAAERPDGEQTVTPQITVKQSKRINAPARNMIISMVAMILILIPVLWLMPRPDKTPYRPQVNVAQVAFESSRQAGFPVAVPQLEGWHYNYARWNGNTPDNIGFFKSGQVTGKNHFIELTQAKDTNPTWVAQQTDNATKQGTEQIAGVEWEVRAATSKKNNERVYSYVAHVPSAGGQSTTIILSGAADPAEFSQLADAASAYLKNPTATADPSGTGSTIR